MRIIKFLSAMARFEHEIDESADRLIESFNERDSIEREILYLKKKKHFRIALKSLEEANSYLSTNG